MTSNGGENCVNGAVLFIEKMRSTKLMTKNNNYRLFLYVLNLCNFLYAEIMNISTEKGHKNASL